MSILERALRKKMMYDMAVQEIPDDKASNYVELYPQWDGNGVQLPEGMKIAYNGAVYKVIQAHVTQSDWIPGTCSMFSEQLTSDTGEPLAWVQPGATNAYMRGDRVIHGDHIWESLIDNNVWEPGATGTEGLWGIVES